MTLNVTVLSAHGIFQSSDHRLTDGDTGKLITDASTKGVELSGDEWNGFVTYTGVGRWKRTDTSDWVVRWVTELQGTPTDIVDLLRTEGTTWLADIRRATGRRHRHTFVFASFVKRRATVWVISNFEDARGRSSNAVGTDLAVTKRSFHGRPIVVITGQKRSVERLARIRLERLVAEEHDPSRIRRALTEVNEAAARAPISKGTISRGCSVISTRADGQGAAQCSGDVPNALRSVLYGMPVPTVAELEAMLGFKMGRMVASTSARFGPRQPFAPCRPQLQRGDPDEYSVTELTHPELASCMARSVIDSNLVLGSGTRDGAPGDSLPWLWSAGEGLELAGFVGDPGGLSPNREIAATARMSDGRDHGVRWRGNDGRDLGCFRGQDSGATGIGDDGTVVGWVCIDAVNRGQGNFRPAAWSPTGELSVLEDFGSDWGQAIATAGEQTLVVAYLRHQPRALLWSPAAGQFREVGGASGVYPMALTRDETVLGKANTNGKPLAVVGRADRGWSRLGTDPGWYATTINDRGDVAGSTEIEGFERPWLRRSTGEIVWLPFYSHHWCRPTTVNSEGSVVGYAQADHGHHALIWTPHR